MHVMHVFIVFEDGVIMKNKNAVDQTLIRSLRAAGCPMPGDCEDDPMPGLAIVVSRPEITKAYVLHSWVEYLFAVRISNDSFALLEVQQFECHLPWLTRLVGPMDPRIRQSEKQTYRLPGSGREFHYKRVLNHRTGRAGRINPGDSLEGILLAFRRCQRFPDECLASDPVIPAELSIVDQFGREHFSEIEVMVDRTAIIHSLKLIGRQGRGLYDTSESQAIPEVRERAGRSVETEIWSDIPDKRVHSEFLTHQKIPNNYS